MKTLILVAVVFGAFSAFAGHEYTGKRPTIRPMADVVEKCRCRCAATATAKFSFCATKPKDSLDYKSCGDKEFDILKKPDTQCDTNDYIGKLCSGYQWREDTEVFLDLHLWPRFAGSMTR